jgi:hypothetical protein
MVQLSNHHDADVGIQPYQLTHPHKFHCLFPYNYNHVSTY